MGRYPCISQHYLLTSAQGGIRRVGYPLLAPLRRQERTIAFTISASYGASPDCSSGCSPERGWTFRKSGICSQAFSKTNDRTALRSSVLRIALSPLFDSSHLTSRSFTVRVSRSFQCLCHPTQTGDVLWPFRISSILFSAFCQEHSFESRRSVSGKSGLAVGR